MVDLSSTEVTTHFDQEKLASLPGARDFFAVVANTPGVALSKMDVGGNNALSLQEYTAYGLRATTGVNRNEVEGIRVGGANGAQASTTPPSKNDLTTSAGFVDDTWRLNRRVTLSLGMRLDRYQPILPEQEGPAGQTFPAIDPVLTFSNWGPRVGTSADLTGDGKTVLKLHYGKFWVYPAPIFTAAFNPNPSGWSQTYLWTNDANTNGRWDPGEEGRLIAVSGGSTSTRLDPGIANTYVRQASAYIEREVAPDFGVRTGVVLNARRQPYGTINVSRPLGAYSVPEAVVDPGPDGRLGSG